MSRCELRTLVDGPREWARCVRSHHEGGEHRFVYTSDVPALILATDSAMFLVALPGEGWVELVAPPLGAWQIPTSALRDLLEVADDQPNP
jgi:hypothetical protein